MNGGWTDERMNDWVDERMNGWTTEADERMNGRMDERKWMNGWTKVDERMNESSCAWCHAGCLISWFEQFYLHFRLNKHFLLVFLKISSNFQRGIAWEIRIFSYFSPICKGGSLQNWEEIVHFSVLFRVFRMFYCLSTPLEWFHAFPAV